MVKNGLLNTVNIDFSRKNIVYPNVNLGKHGPSIVQDKSHTYLGLCFQSDALWTSHIHTIHDKATKRLNILRMLKHKVNRKTLVNIYILLLLDLFLNTLMLFGITVQKRMLNF